MLRLGEIVKQDKNPLMVVSKNYEDVVKKLASFDFPSDGHKLLACLVLSQTEKQYKKYLIHALSHLKDLSEKKLIDDWQNGTFKMEDKDFKDLFSIKEWKILSGLNIETHLEVYEKEFLDLFNDGFNNAFYPMKKKGMAIIRHLATRFVKGEKSLSDLQKLVLYFIIAQLLISWESSCIHLGMMLLTGWSIADMEKWFCATWPVYKVLDFVKISKA